jgi:hypothetical protein
MQMIRLLGQATLAAMVVATIGLTSTHAKSGEDKGVCEQERAKGQKAVDHVYDIQKQGRTQGQENLEQWYEKKKRELAEAEQRCKDIRSDELITKESPIPDNSQPPSSNNPLGDLTKKLPKDMRNTPHWEPHEEPPLKDPSVYSKWRQHQGYIHIEPRFPQGSGRYPQHGGYIHRSPGYYRQR